MSGCALRARRGVYTRTGPATLQHVQTTGTEDASPSLRPPAGFDFAGGARKCVANVRTCSSGKSRNLVCENLVCWFGFDPQIIKTHPRSQDGSQQHQRIPTTTHTTPRTGSHIRQMISCCIIACNLTFAKPKSLIGFPSDAGANIKGSSEGPRIKKQIHN